MWKPSNKRMLSLLPAVKCLSLSPTLLHRCVVLNDQRSVNVHEKPRDVLLQRSESGRRIEEACKHKKRSGHKKKRSGHKKKRDRGKINK
jgi:hypothetical protein